VSRIRDIARVTMKEARGAETVEQQAWLVWRTLRTACERNGVAVKKVWQDNDGYQLSISLHGVIMALWPEWSMMERREFSNKTQPIYTYLKHSANARCLHSPGRNTTELPLWWIRTEWFGGQAIVVPAMHHPRDPDRDRRERRLTPAEAGEDRVPGPVVVTAAEATTAPPAMPEPERKRPRPSQDTIDKFVEARDVALEQRKEAYRVSIVNALIDADGWVPSTVLAETLGKYPTAVKRYLDGFVEDGLVERGKRVKAGTLYRACGASDNVAEQTDDGPQNHSETGANPDSPAPTGSTIEPAGAPDVVDIARTPLRKLGLGGAVERISALIEQELSGLDVERITRERDDALLAGDVLRAENKALKAKLSKFRKMLED